MVLEVVMDLLQPHFLMVIVDTRTELHVREAMTRPMAGRTSLAIAHRLSTIRNASLIVVMDGGRVVEQGTHAELVAATGLYRRLYHMHFSRHPSARSPGTPAG